MRRSLVRTGHQFLSSGVLQEFVQQSGKRIALISDTIVAPLHAEKVTVCLTEMGANVKLFTLPATEQHKNYESVRTLQEEILAWGIDRDTLIVTLGGGVVSDIGGFIAATLLRGLELLHIPTTLLGMVDAAIGGKTGYNTPQGKNLVGAVKHPLAILIDTSFLSTLPGEHFREGVAEMLKHGIVVDREHFQEVNRCRGDLLSLRVRTLNLLVSASGRIKERIVEKDPTEQGIRHILNFGHTTAHAIEKISGYKVSHGEAVAIGCCVEAEMACLLGYCPREDVNIISAAFMSFGLPVTLPEDLDLTAVEEAMLWDKKCKRSLPRFVILQGLGKCGPCEGAYCTTVSDGLVTAALEARSGDLCLN